MVCDFFIGVMDATRVELGIRIMKILSKNDSKTLEHSEL